MQLRLRSLIAPLVKGGIWLLRRFDVSPQALHESFFIIVLFAAGIYVWLSTTPFSQVILTASVVMIFVSGIVDEVRREYGVSDTVASRYADFILYGGILYYLMQGSYINFYITSKGHYILGGALIGGVLLLNKILELTVRGERNPGFEVPAERLIFLTVFAITGYNHSAYEDFLFVGLAMLTLLLYSYSALLYINYKGFSISSGRGKSALLRVLSVYQDGVEKMKAGAWIVYRFLKRTLHTRAPQGRAPARAEVPQEAAHGYNFTVMVLNAEEQPVVDSVVAMSSADGSLSETKYTDIQGKCVFSNLREGQYTISIEAEGLPAGTYERYISMDSGEVFRLEASILDLSVVVNDSKEMRPIPNALVTLETPEGEVFERRTDNLGVAYFDRLSGGKTTLTVEAQGYISKTRRIDPAVENVVSINMRRKQLVEIRGSLLVEYMEHGAVEEAVGIVIDAYKEQGEKPCLISTTPLLEKFSPRVVRPVDFSSVLPEDIEIIMGELPSGGAMIFEAGTELIHRLGLDEALRFMAKLATYANERGIGLVAFINKGAHGERIAAMFEKLFEDVAEYREGGLVEKGEIS